MSLLYVFSISSKMEVKFTSALETFGRANFLPPLGATFESEIHTRSLSHYCYRRWTRPGYIYIYLNPSNFHINLFWLYFQGLNEFCATHPLLEVLLIKPAHLSCSQRKKCWCPFHKKNDTLWSPNWSLMNLKILGNRCILPCSSITNFKYVVVYNF